MASKEECMRRRGTLCWWFEAAITGLAIFATSLAAQQQSSPGPHSKTQVVLLGQSLQQAFDKT